MQPDLWELYPLMLKSRLFEEAIAKLWHDGFISGEMHLGTGEEGIMAGIVPQLREGDAMALDHRGTAALLMRGVDPAAILRELLGHPDGLCGGRGGHMHLYSKDHLAASSGIVGAAGPCAAGFGLAAQYLNPGAIAVAFFGEGAMNQGMLMESLNLAAVWRLPVLFVCKDDGWSITTHSEQTTGTNMNVRAHGLGVPAVEVDGSDVAAIWDVSGEAIARARAGNGPTFLHARCIHLEGHFLGYEMLRIIRDPLRTMPNIALPMARSFLNTRGARLQDRLAGVNQVLSDLAATLRDPRQDPANDPIHQVRQELTADLERLAVLEDSIRQEIREILASVLPEVAR